MLKLAVIGADKRTRKMLQLFFSGPGQGAGKLVSEQEAEADIVDVVGFYGDDVWQKHRKCYKRPAIVLSVEEKRYPGAIWVPKPIQKADFLKALAALKEKVELSTRVQNGVNEPLSGGSALSSADSFSAREFSLAAGKALVDYRHEYLCGEYPDTVYLDPRYRSRLFYHPEHSLQYAVSRAIEFSRESGSNMLLSGLPQTITVFSSGKYVYCPYSQDQLRELARHELSQRELAVSAMHGDFMVNDDDRQVIRADKFLWEVALLCSRGRVPFGTNLQDRVGINAWPNLTRLQLIPHAMQLSALWQSAPFTLHETAEKLGIRYRYVYAFYSGCSALGVRVSNPDVIENQTVAAAATEKSVIARLLSYFGRVVS